MTTQLQLGDLAVDVVLKDIKNVHLEPTHNSRFIGLMGHFMPKWQFYRDELNGLPVRHEHWLY